MISTVIAISVWVPVSLLAAVVFYCLIRSGEEDGRSAELYGKDEADSVASQRRLLRVVRQKD